uniref:U3 small nucleolar RNA-associated protein 25 homolog n=1 Tax=Ditylenchus dipsaci TaxID=166011 RepID=A0A915CML2_9BILA
MKRSAKEFAADDEVPDGTATKRQSIEKQRDFFKKHFLPALKNFMSYAIWRGQKEISFIDEDRLQLTGSSDALDDELYQVIGRYMDLCFVSKKDFTPLICLHSLNHVMRTRQLIIQNKMALEARKNSVNDEMIEKCRDQGLARPKVLILCPYRKHAHHYVKTLVKLVFADSDKSFVSNLSKFEDEFGDDGNRVHEKRNVSLDYKVLMSGNVDDCFRIGIGLAKKCLKLYTSFEESDILLCSPLGLRMIIGDETEAKREFDFLASIEVLVIDKAHLLLMQNWEHLSDISRVRQWALNDYSKYYRQTLIFSEVNSVEIQALFSRFCRNYAGMISLVKSRQSIIEQIELPIVQGFYRFQLESPEKQSDNRFNFFVKELLQRCEQQTLIFVSSYYDFVRLRNHLKKENESFTQIHEYAEKGKVAKARNLFFLAQKKLLLMTERYYFYFRAHIKGVKSVLFYQLPVNPQFYVEIINGARPDQKLNSKVLFCEFDFIRMQNIFGNATARDLIKSAKPFRALIGE